MFIKKFPSLIQKYVSFNLFAIKLIVKTLNAYMKHLCDIQGLDSNIDPETKKQLELRSDLENYFNDSFKGIHSKDFDDDFDFSFLKQKWKKCNETLKGISLSEEKFTELTDINKLTDSDVKSPQVIKKMKKSNRSKNKVR